MQSVINSNNIKDVKDIILTTPKPNSATKNLSAAILNGLSKTGLYIEIPYTIAPFGVSAYDPNKTSDESKKSFTLSLKATAGNGDDQAKVDHLFKIMREIENAMIDWGIQHSQLIFKKKYDPTPAHKGIVEALYKKCIKQSVGKDGTVYPDRFDVKIMKKEDGSPDILVFKNSPNPLEIKSFAELESLVTKGMAVKAIIQPRIYFMPGSYGMNIKLIQLKLPNNSQKIGRPIAYAFEEELPKESATAPVSVIQLNKDDGIKASSNDVEDIDVDDDDDNVGVEQVEDSEEEVEVDENDL
jgi:hypothetical protein